MSSTILYKFRSGTNFEALPLPGTAARLFDVKRAIVKAKKLDVVSGGSALEFDLSVRDATTQEEYADESMLLPRGTRVIVQRLPAARGHGFLARMARAESGMVVAGPIRGAAAPTGFYTIESRDRDEEDEFVQSAPAAAPENGGGTNEEKELAALMAVTDPGTGTSATSGFRPAVSSGGHRMAGAGPPPPPPRHQAAGYYQKQNHRPNADPELREQERMPKKRATGIPRTFLNLSAPPVTDGSGQEGEGMDSVARLQPNALGFKALVDRGGGQSESATGTRRDLDYALKLTATTIPEHLQCGICHGVVKNAMLLPWDVEGRTACENCIRDALTQNGFRCPLTGIEGVSPDDLHPNHGLRKAADLFIKGVMEKMEEIETQQVEEPEPENESAGDAAEGFEGDMVEKGVILSRKTSKDHKYKKHDDDDPFGGGDDFGGDVFEVAADSEQPDEDNLEGDGVDTTEKAPEEAVSKETSEATGVSESNSTLKPLDERKEQDGDGGVPAASEDAVNKSNQSESQQNAGVTSTVQEPASSSAGTPSKAEDSDSAAPRASPTSDSGSSAPTSRRDARRRGPPAGYTMGPAGGAAVRSNGPYGDGPSPRGEGTSHPPVRGGGHGSGGRGGPGRGFSSPQAGRGGGGYHYQDRPPFRGRGRGGRFQSGGRFPPGDFDGGRGEYRPSSYPSAGRGGDDRMHHQVGDDSRGTKRTRDASEETSPSEERHRVEQHGGHQNGPPREWAPGGGRGGRFDSSRGRGPPQGQFRGGPGDYGGRRGGRGFYRGRGGYGRGGRY